MREREEKKTSLGGEVATGVERVKLPNVYGKKSERKKRRREQKLQRGRIKMKVKRVEENDGDEDERSKVDQQVRSS